MECEFSKDRATSLSLLHRLWFILVCLVHCGIPSAWNSYCHVTGPINICEMNEWVEIYILGRVETLYIPFADLSLLPRPPRSNTHSGLGAYITTHAFIL